MPTCTHSSTSSTVEITMIFEVVVSNFEEHTDDDDHGHDEKMRKIIFFLTFGKRTSRIVLISQRTSFVHYPIVMPNLTFLWKLRNSLAEHITPL